MTAPANARLTAALADRYRLEGELGAGGMATVYLAQDLKHDRRVAVKVLRPELAAVIGAERFLSEIKTTANLQHPHVLPLHDSGEADGFLFYVMPYVEGVSLRERITREHQLPVDDAVRIAREVAGALDYAHRHGVIHRDIKPENILLHDGSALVADFGIALAVSTAGTRMTETGMSLGTPHYMSPEQAMGEREISARSDVYALGCVTYEMLLGEPPFTGPTAQAIIARVMTEDPRRLTTQRRSIPPHVEDAVLHALEKLPADRFATAAQFADALSGAGPTQALHHGGTVRADAMTAVWRRRFQTAAAVALVALALGVWGWARARNAAVRPVMRSYLSLGDSAGLQTALTNGHPLALSPDGSLLVFVGDSLSRLWVKRRDAADPVLLPGTEHATNPTFSPDGRWLAYIANGRLRKIRVGGGAGVVLADSASEIGGVAWLDDGTLVFPNSQLLGLRRVSQSGGAVTVALPDTVLGGLAPLMPTPLPRARGVLYQVCGSGCATMSLHVLDLATGREKILLDDIAMGWYLPTGHLLYARRDGVMLIVPFDLDKLAIHGAAAPVLEDVARTQSIVDLAWSPSGVLVYATAGSISGGATIYRVGRDGQAAMVDSTWTGDFNSLARSPDGRRVAVGVVTPGAGLNIWIKRLDRGPFTRLTFSGHDRRPAWSPDGREIAFIRDSAIGGDVFVRAADGGGAERRLTHYDRAIQEVAWSPDGRWLLVRTETGAAGNGDILALPTGGDTAVMNLATTRFAELQPAVSPDGRWLAYVSNEAGLDEVYVRPFSAADAGKWQVSNGGGESPVWSPDGRELFFLGAATRLVAASVAPGPDFSVTDLHPLFDASRFGFTGYHQGFDVTRDGHFLLAGPLQFSALHEAHLVQVDNWFADLRARLAP